PRRSSGHQRWPLRARPGSPTGRPSSPWESPPRSSLGASRQSPTVRPSSPWESPPGAAPLGGTWVHRSPAVQPSGDEGRECPPWGAPGCTARPRRPWGGLEVLVEQLLEAPCVGLLGLGEGLEPVGDLFEALLAGGLRHARVHVGVLVGLACDAGLEVVLGVADRQAGGGVAGGPEVVEVAVRMAGLALGGVAEVARDLRVTLHVGLLGEVEIATVGLRLAREGGLE